MKSAELKSEGLCWLRYGKRADWVCSEGGPWYSDVLGITGTMAIEVEVKVSKGDFVREFTNKRTKHYMYNNPTSTRWIPNYFYILVPPELAESAVELLKKHGNKKYGILTVDSPRARPGNKLKVVKKASKLHDKPPTEVFKQVVLRRMGSELCGLHLALDSIYAKSPGVVPETLRDEIIDTIVQALGAGEWEFPDEEATVSTDGGGREKDPVPGDSGN